MTPALWIPVSQLDQRSGTGPHLRWVNPMLAERGWRTFFESEDTLTIVDRFGPTVAVLWLPHGQCSPWYPAVPEIGRGRTQSDEKRQDFEGYAIAKYQGILQDTLMDNDALSESIAAFRSRGCEVVPYVGPWNRRTEPTRDRVAACVEPWANGIVDRLFVDGAGASDQSALDSHLRHFGLEMLPEPMSQIIDRRGKPIPDLRARMSFTLSQTLNHPGAFYDDYPANVVRLWLDNERRHDDADFWERYEQAESKGFTPCLPFSVPVWEAWQRRYGR